MTTYYLDTSALVKLYLPESGSERVRRIYHSSKPYELAILSITQVELRSALRRRERSGSIESGSVERVLARFATDLESVFTTLPITDPILNLACSIVDRHPVRASDALQLAGCIFLQESVSPSPVFVCTDRQLLRAARAEGLSCLNPTE